MNQVQLSYKKEEISNKKKSHRREVTLKLNMIIINDPKKF